MPEESRQIVRTYYKSLTPNGNMWCESRDPDEVRRHTHPTEKLTYEKFEIYEISDGWQTWEL